MKDKKKYLNSIIYIVLIGIIISLISNKAIIGKEKHTIKEMTEGEYESKITELNTSHKDYALQVQENKKKLATAISNEKVETSENATIDEMVTNIGKILKEGTADATATADNITAGKTAYVNGQLIIGNGTDNETYFNNGKEQISKTLKTESISTGDLNDNNGSQSIVVPEGYEYYILVLSNAGTDKAYANNISGCGAKLINYVTATDVGIIKNGISVYILSSSGTVTFSETYGRKYLLSGIYFE